MSNDVHNSRQDCFHVDDGFTNEFPFKILVRVVYLFQFLGKREKEGKVHFM